MQREAIDIKGLKRIIPVCLVLTALIMVSYCNTAAQEVRLRRGDRLGLVVPQRQELNRQLTIGENGNVLVPVLGEIHFEGIMLTEAEQLLLRRLREVYPSIQQIILSLMDEESRRLIYVHGEVLNPGKYEFMKNPNLWEAVREAGGSTATAALEAVRIIRAEEEGRRTFIVNLQEVINNGKMETLPELRPGDTVIVPVRMAQYTGSGSVRVIGMVLHPGPYQLSGTQSLTDAILAAGGPDSDANLGRVKIIRHLAEGAVVTIQVDYAQYLATGDARQNPAILPNDTVNVPRDRNVMRVLFSDPRYLLGSLTATAALIAVARR